jgi:hypothetical protein
MSAILTRPMDPREFPAVYGALLRDFQGGRIPETTWRRLVEHEWAPAGTPRGHVLLEGDRIVGFMGCIFADRTIAGRRERICNLTSLVVAEPWRRHSLSFIVSALRMPGVTITDLTPTPAVAAILRRVGFVELERSVTVLLPVPGGAKRKSAVVQDDPEAFAAALPAEDARAIADHRPHRCEALMLEDRDGPCHVVFGRHRSRGVRYATIYAVGRPEVFRRESAALRGAILSRTGAMFAVADTRLLGGDALPFSFRWSLTAPRMVRSALSPGQVDNLYSEFVLLQLATLPRLRRAGAAAATALLNAAIELA